VFIDQTSIYNSRSDIAQSAVVMALLFSSLIEKFQNLLRVGKDSLF